MDNMNKAKAAETIVAIYKANGVKTVDSHQLERDVMAYFPVAFMQDFLGYTGKVDPLLAFSQDFGRWIKSDWTAKKLVSATGNKPVTATLRGTDSANEEWIVL